MYRHSIWQLTLVYEAYLSSHCPCGNECSSNTLSNFISNIFKTNSTIPHMCISDAITQVDQKVVNMCLVTLCHNRTKLEV